MKDTIVWELAVDPKNPSAFGIHSSSVGCADAVTDGADEGNSVGPDDGTSDGIADGV